MKAFFYILPFLAMPLCATAQTVDHMSDIHSEDSKVETVAIENLLEVKMLDGEKWWGSVTDLGNIMPMMQFSVAPWRILSPENLAICRKYALLHQEMGAYILSCAEYSALTGEPIVRAMDYEFPGQGFEECNDQYMLGDKILVAPVMDTGTSRSVKLPKGNWTDEFGKVYRGGRTYTIDVPLDRLPRFTRR